jgi:hypothetical protein
MIKCTLRPLIETIGVFLVSLMLCGPVFAADEATVEAFATWEGRGQLFETGPKEMTFVGALSGVLYVKTEKGPLNSGRLTCPAIVVISIEDGSQNGTGRCTITSKDGARVYAEITCSGYHLVGCDGDLKFTGGTGRFEGITGGGKLTIRSEFGEIDAVSEAAAQEDTKGIIYWPELHYALP